MELQSKEKAMIWLKDEIGIQDEDARETIYNGLVKAVENVIFSALEKERIRCRDIAYEFFNRLNADVTSLKKLEPAHPSVTTRIHFKEKESDLARQIGNAISGSNALTPDSEKMIDRVHNDYKGYLEALLPFMPIKGKKKAFQPPEMKEVVEYFVTNGYPAELAERAFLGYQDNNWHDSHGQPIRNWRQKMRFVWMKPENKPSHKAESGTHPGQHMNTGNVTPSKF